ncbi:MAG: exopolysaccharide biosynthesis polyprenyl glycosylphosphotransferase [Pseudomonadota bacterium]
MNLPQKTAEPAIPFDSQAATDLEAEVEAGLVFLSSQDYTDQVLDVTRQDITRNASKRRSRARLDAGLCVVDILCIIAAFALANIARLGIISIPQISNMLAVCIPIYLATAFNSRAYGSTVLGSFWTSYTRAATSFLLAMGAVVLTAFFLKASADFSRFIFLTGGVLGLIFLFAGRWLMSQLAKRILGSNPMAEIIIQDGVSIHYTGNSPLIDAVSQKLEPDLTNPVIVQRLGLMTQNMDRVVVHCTPEKRQAWAFTLKALDINAEIVIPELDDLAPIALDRRDGHIALSIAQGPLKWNERITKRLFDIAFVMVALPILALPMLVVAILIKLESPGPALFKQKRIGLGNRPFYILKFRSMRSEKCDANGDRSTGRDDDRITRLGAFIRKTSIDELPQLFNVLVGDMSVVGPRPHAIGSRAENLLFWDIDSRYWHRHAVKPGLTGLAQIRGYRGATEKRQDLEDRLRSDLDYRANWSLWGDIKIVLMTFRVLIHRNAY